MSWQLFCSIVDQIPNLSRAVLHGLGEPMLVKNTRDISARRGAKRGRGTDCNCGRAGGDRFPAGALLRGASLKHCARIILIVTSHLLSSQEVLI
jgi:hypothetical protein